MSDTNTTNAPKTLAEALAAIAALRAEQRAKAALMPTAAPTMTARSVDAFGSPVGTGTHSMHVVLASAYAAGVLLTRAEIRDTANYQNFANHLNTMRTKGRVVSDGRGLWRLSDAAGALWHGQGKPFGFSPIDGTPSADRPVAGTPDAPTADVPGDDVIVPGDDVTPPAEPMPTPPGDDTAGPRWPDDEKPAGKGKGRKGK